MLGKHRGFTLVELVVATAIASAAAAFMIGTLARQQRFHASAAKILDVRAQVRDAADVLATDLRSAAVASFGFPLMTDSAVEMFATIASSIVCATPSAQSFTLPPAALASGNTLTAMLAQPDTGDIALVYSAPSASPDSGDWLALRISAFASRSVSSACPSSTGFTTASDPMAGAQAHLVSTTTVLPLPLRAGAPVHFVRRGRYSLYRSSDSKWYLGYRRCSAWGPSACGSIQPVSGPYDPYSSDRSKSGLVFRYFDESGLEVVSGASSTVARVEISMRGAASSSGLTGDLGESYRDSAVISVSPRNRAR